jgi:hypothetical protein
MRKHDINLLFLNSPHYASRSCSSVQPTIANDFNSDINALILDYLTMEGYPNAAANFSKEANLAPHQETPSIIARQEIQKCIHSGNIQTAIETLNDFDPEVRTFPARITAHAYMIRTRVLHAPLIEPSGL